MTTYFQLLGGFFGQDEPYDELGLFESYEALQEYLDDPERHPDEVIEFDFYTHREIQQ